jgi:succinylglutamate desuccinylase
MKVEGATRNPDLAIIGCQHGDERIGQEMIDRFRPLLDELPGLQLILANEEAMARGQRFIDADLNRSYPGSPEGNHEERLAVEMLRALQQTRFVIDLHSTDDDAVVFPIITEDAPGTRRLINATDFERIVLMNVPHGGGSSGLGNIPGDGIGLEYGEAYYAAASDQIFGELDRIARRVLSGERREPQPREVFEVTAVATPWERHAHRELTNFDYSPELGGYAIMPDESAYQGVHRGFVATGKRVAAI